MRTLDRGRLARNSSLKIRDCGRDARDPFNTSFLQRIGLSLVGQGPTLLFLLLSLSASAHPLKRDIAQPGNLAYQQQDYGKAVAEYTKAQDLEPLSAEIRYNLGAAQFRQEEYDTALEEFTEGARADDLLMAAQAYYNLGNARYKKSKREFEATSVEAQGQEGAKNPVQEYVQKLENCVKDYEECLKRNPNDADAKYNLEVIRREIKNLMRRDPNQQQNQDQQQQQKNQDQQNQEQQNQDQNQQQQSQQEQEQQQENQEQENQEQQNQDQSQQSRGESTPTPQAQPQPQPGEATPTPQQAGQNSDTKPSEAEPQPTQALNISEEMARNILDNLPERRPRQSRQSRKKVEKDW